MNDPRVKPEPPVVDPVPPIPDLLQIGKELEKSRLKRGLSTAEVATAINLRQSVVRAMEQGDFSSCGGSVYARGHIRAYARQVGLDPTALLDGLRDPTEKPTVEPIRTRVGARTIAGAGAPPMAFPNGPLEKSGPNWTIIAAVLVGVVAVVLGAGLVKDLVGSGRNSPAEPASSQSSAASPPAAAPSAATPSSAATSASPTTPSPQVSALTRTPPPIVGVSIALTVTERSWISVRNSTGKKVFEGIAESGTEKTFTDPKTLELSLGNAGGVELSVNGKPKARAGRPGQVLRLTLPER